MTESFDELDLTYSYNPTTLLESWNLLAEKESELLSRTALTASVLEQRATLATTSMAVDGFEKVVVAATQITGAGLPPSDVSGFCFRAEQAIEHAARQEATIVVLPEFWSSPYFCQSQEAILMGVATEIENSILLRRMQQLARLYGVVIVAPFYERRNQALYSSVCAIDSDGTIVGVYRKSHVRDGPGAHEKFYFAPGDTGFKVFQTNVCKIGVALGYDLWFPECARAMALQGADLLVYSTTFGSDPQSPTPSVANQWQRTLQSHAAVNIVPIVCSNRFGTEILCSADGVEHQRIDFVGKSCILDATGLTLAKCAASNRKGDVCKNNGAMQPIMVVVAEIDLGVNRQQRLASGLFRDRRPDQYGVLLTKDGMR